MALTGAEKTKRRREKLKQLGMYEEFKVKHRQQAKASREKKKKLLEKLPFKFREVKKHRDRLGNRARVQRWRLLRKESIEPTSSNVEDSAQKLKESESGAIPLRRSKRRNVLKKDPSAELGCGTAKQTSPKKKDVVQK